MQNAGFVPCSGLRAGDLLQFLLQGAACLVLCEPLAVQDGLLARFRREGNGEAFTLLVKPETQLRIIDRRQVDVESRSAAAAALRAQAAMISTTGQPSQS